MYQIDNSTAAATQPASTAAGTAGFFTDGNAATGVAATVLPAELMNALMLETLNVITAAGITPSKTSFTQLRDAIKGISQQGTAIYAADTGTATAYRAAFSPAITTLTDGMRLYVRAANTNTGATPTLVVNAMAAKTIVKGAGSALSVSDILAGGLMMVVYDQARDAWVLLNPSIGANTVTAWNDSGFADDSDRPLSTGWLRRAMGTLASAAGFAASFGTNGYLKLPNWLGSFILQWGTVNANNLSTLSVTYPLAFPSACYGVWQSTYNDTAGSTDAARRATSSTPLTTANFRLTNADGGTSLAWLSIGR